jgi:GT2 family glycosyltransferase
MEPLHLNGPEAARTDLSVVIVNFNGKNDLLRCLASLNGASSGRGVDVIVVDNGSSDGSIEAAEGQFPSVRFLRLGKNVGFAAACNYGMAEAKGRHIMLLNPDTEVLPGALAELVRALDAHGEWGIVGPRMVDSADQAYRAARRFPTPFYLFCECTRLAYLFPRSIFGIYFYGDNPPDMLDQVEQIEGSALVISEAARAMVGPLDEQFFLFFEEVDWCRRVIMIGLQVHVVQSATVRHHRSTTMSRNYLAARVANAESAMKYFFKYHGREGVASLRRWMRTALTLRILGAKLISLFGRKELARLRIEGARMERDVYRRGLTA